MFKLKLKHSIVIAILAVIAISPLFADVTYEGDMYLFGEWRNGTASGSSICFNDDGTMTIQPPVTIKAGGITITSTDPITVPVRGARKAISLSSNEAADINIFVRDGLNVNSKEALNVSVYDISGRCVYSSNNITNAVINKNVITTNGSYILHLSCEEGDITSINFMFIDGAIYLSK